MLKETPPFSDGLQFSDSNPRAAHGLGGLVRDHFANGRLFITAGSQGGLLEIGYWGQQHLGAKFFFRGDPQSAWIKLFRLFVGIGDKHYYVTLTDTELLPFGWKSSCQIEDVELEHQLLLLPDTLVQRIRILKNPRGLEIRIEMLHHEACTAIERKIDPSQVSNGIPTAATRTWRAFEFSPKTNTLITSCVDDNPEVYRGDASLANADLGITIKDAPHAVTWMGLSSDVPFSSRIGFHRRSKYYLKSDGLAGNQAAFYLTFATSAERLAQRLAELSKTVQQECDQMLTDHALRLRSRPQIKTGLPVLDSAFSQYPELIHQMKVPDQPGAVRATFSGYFVWGWDGMMPIIPCTLANEADYAADILRFFHKEWNPVIGFPHQFTSQFGVKLKGPFSAQCQFIASLYHYVAVTGDLSLAKELMPTCRLILDKCREHLVKDTGMVSGNALWPDHPEAMDENGSDVSSMNNSLVYQGLRAMEYLASAAGDAKLATDCRDWARTLRLSFIKYFYDEEKGHFISSCSSKDLKPRQHYCCQAIFWLTVFARELVSHAPQRIASFMHQELRSDKCLLSLPVWDTAWMADGNQLGSSFPAAEAFYLNVHKLVGDGRALKAWLGDVEWFWRRHTAPEAFTPEAENEAEMGPDNPGCKQLQTCSTWFTCLYAGLAGLDFDHEGITITPWGDLPLEINGLCLRGVSIDLKISGIGRHISSLSLNGNLLPAGSHKIDWKQLDGKAARLELMRSEKAPENPVIVRADGLRVTIAKTEPGRISARIEGGMSSEVVVSAPQSSSFVLNEKPIHPTYDSTTGTFSVPIEIPGVSLLTVTMCAAEVK